MKVATNTMGLMIGILMLFSLPANSQINKDWDGTKPEIYAGAKSFVFLYAPFVSSELNGSFAGFYNIPGDTVITTATDITFQNVYGVGFRYFVSNRFDINTGLNISSASVEEQGSTSGTTRQKLSAFVFGISVDGNYRLRTLYNISPYIGANINFSSISGEIKNVSGSTFIDEISGTTFGFGLNFGFDWYFTPGMSLGGKYTLGWVGSGGLEETVSNATVTQNIKYPKMNMWGTGIASILLNVHF